MYKNKPRQLHDLGQSLWLDNITREMLDDGTLRRYIDEFAVTGLTSNPTIFDEAIGKSGAYDEGIHEKARAGKSGEALFMELALEDLRRAADLFRFIEKDQRVHLQFEEVGFPRVLMNARELPARNRVSGDGVFGEWEDGRRVYLQHGALRLHIEPAHFLNRVAE